MLSPILLPEDPYLDERVLGYCVFLKGCTLHIDKEGMILPPF